MLFGPSILPHAMTLRTNNLLALHAVWTKSILL